MTAEEAINCLEHPTDYWPSDRRKADDIAIEALRKQIPIQYDDNKGWMYCPGCGKALSIDRVKFCSDCGQALKWEDDDV